MTKATKNHGLSKRCDCARRKWNTCPHPYHFDFFKGKKYRYSLDALAKARGVDAPRTKDAAEALADVIRSEIRLGTFRDPKKPAPVALDPAGPWTVGDVLDQYERGHVEQPGRRASGVRTMRAHLAVLRRVEIPGAHGQMVRFAQKAIKDVVTADIAAIRSSRHTQRPGSKGVGTNRLLSRLRHVFAWSIEHGFTTETPFKRHGQVVIRLTKEAPRFRRLEVGEEERLLAAAAPHLKALIIAALSTGCRCGELLNLQFKDIRSATTAQGQTRQWFMIRAEKAKTATTREVPVGTRLAAVLDLRRHAPDGTPLGPDAFVFGNRFGEKVTSVKKAWQVAVLRAHDVVPVWVKAKKNHLAPESQAAYRAIGLRLHDLRREFGSRILESGSSLVEARDLLGHANIAQTSSYLASTAKSLTSAIDKKELYEQALAEARQRAEAEAQQAATTAPVPVSGPERPQ